jgi:2-hydroxychromene-2-carboxylate isomerase
MAPAHRDPTIDFWFEFASTYSYLAASRTERLTEDAGVAVAWRPFLLGPIFQAQGWSDSPFNVYPAKGRYMWRDVERLCSRYGMPFRRPTQFPRNGLLAARVACLGRRTSWCPEFTRRVFRANFAEDRDIADPSVLADILQMVGVDDAAVIAEATTAENKGQLRRDTDEAMRLGIFGAPTFAVGGELFWGHDRLEDAVAWAQLESGGAEIVS